MTTKFDFAFHWDSIKNMRNAAMCRYFVCGPRGADTYYCFCWGEV